MKKFALMGLCALVLIGCSSQSNTEELNALSKRVAELESELSELNTPEPTPTNPYADLTFDDFNPTCVVTDIDQFGDLRYDVSITNVLRERSTYYIEIDILYLNNWIESSTATIYDIPSGLSDTTERRSVRATDGRTKRLLDYKCEIVEFNQY